MVYKLSTVAKAVVAGLAAGASALAVAAQDGVIDGPDLLTIALAIAGAFGVTWKVPNK